MLSLRGRLFPVFTAASGWTRDALQLWFNLKPILREVTVPALFMGFAYPLANAAIQRTHQAVGRYAGLLYLANTVGAVGGALTTGFVLLPRLGMQRTVIPMVAATMLGTACLYLASRLLVTPRLREPSLAKVVGASIVTTGLVLGVWIALPSDRLISRTLSPVPAPVKLLDVREGTTEVVAVAEMPGAWRQLITNGHSMSSTDLLSQRYMRAFAHIPLLSMEAPERVLVICFGVGNTIHAASLHPSVHDLELVDLSRNVLDHGAYFEATNGGVLKHPKLTVYVNDGRHHLRMRPSETYDLITMEPPPITFAGVASLYSREFYELARTRLKPGGYVTQWLPVYQVPGPTALAMIRAFVEVFPQSVLLSGAGYDLILLGVKDSRLEFDPARVAARLAARPAVLTDLTRVGLGTLTEIVGTFVAAGQTLSRATKYSPPVTDDHPVIEYAVSSRLIYHDVANHFFDLGAVSLWCPACFSGGRPIAELDELAPYLVTMGALYGLDPRASGSLPSTRPAVRPTGGLATSSPDLQALQARARRAGRPDDPAVGNGPYPTATPGVAVNP